MNVLVTGAKGFIGKNACYALKEAKHRVFEFDVSNTGEELIEFVQNADAIIHLAGVNRPLNPEEFIDGNVNLTKRILDLAKTSDKKPLIIFASSTQATLDNPYGQSKKQAEDLLLSSGHPVVVYRLYNVFGKWCRPNYNSVIATFCHNVANGLPLQINKEAPAIDFVYIDDVVSCLIQSLLVKQGDNKIRYPEPHYSRKLDDIAGLLLSFKESRNTFFVPSIEDDFARKLYATYLSYLPENQFAYPLEPHVDERGSFTEILKTFGFGQISVNVAKPGITKGNHYHNTKNEKYLVVHGECEIKFRKLGSKDVITYRCSDKKLEVVDIPVGYTHSITNVGNDDSVTLMWASEQFDPKNPDTFYCPVEQ